mmetsp:Transcript_9575/g.19120  ORF Transcript_9575/g.19120 Transcript_9575/m.19120 type:complete len:219 (+) Transcript_9575:59-715(+)
MGEGGLGSGAGPVSNEGNEAPGGDKAGSSREAGAPELSDVVKKDRKVRNVWAVPFHRESPKNKLLVQEVMKQNPFSTKFGKVKVMWDSIAQSLNKADVFQKSRCDHQGCQNQIKKLVDYWERRRAVHAQLQNTLSEWEKDLEKLIEMKKESEHLKNKRSPVMTFEEEMQIYNQGGLKRPWQDAAEISKVLEEHGKRLKRMEERMERIEEMLEAVARKL